MNTERLIERFGADRNVYIVRTKLSEDGCQRQDKKTPCTSRLPDALLVDAMLAKTKNEALKPELFDEAQKLRDNTALA